MQHERPSGSDVASSEAESNGLLANIVMRPGMSFFGRALKALSNKFLERPKPLRRVSVFGGLLVRVSKSD